MDGADFGVVDGCHRAIAGDRGWRRTLEKSVRFILPADIPFWKRALDFGLIVILLPSILPAGILIALLVKLGSKGPVFFKQRRVGYRGKEFTCFKFRTMRTNAETDSHKSHTQQLIQSGTPMVKLDSKKDPRVIPFGRLLRVLGLDELPQLINVVRGEMSIVGPRPCISYEHAMYKPWHCERLNAVPGLTGLWQVSGKNRTTFDQMVQYDIEYTRRQSLWLDLSIIIRTAPAIWVQFSESRAARKQASEAPPAPQEKSQFSLESLQSSVPSFRL